MNAFHTLVAFGGTGVVSMRERKWRRKREGLAFPPAWGRAGSACRDPHGPHSPAWRVTGAGYKRATARAGFSMCTFILLKFKTHLMK